MQYFIFRNTTIERFFQNSDVIFSGYEDISEINEKANRYLWFYLAPIEAERETKTKKIRYYAELLQMVAANIPPDKMFIVFTMKDIFNIQAVITERTITDAVEEYNSMIHSLSENHDNIKVLDFAVFIDSFKYEDRFDWRYYFISQMGLNPRLSGAFEQWFEVQIRAIEMKRKKCLILDLDNTLWGGILGEDGVMGVVLGGDYPGKAFFLFQQQILELCKQGIILAVCSKNNVEDVRKMWKTHPDVVLKEENFAAMRINWNNKADNIREIAQELNIGLDSLVFLDDSPSERELINRILPEVTTPDFPEQPYMLPAFLKKVVEQYFTVYNLTDEDKTKNAQYKANAQRTQIQHSFANMEDYIRHLEIELTVAEVNDLTLTRAAQMTQKTNQFNLTTHRYTDTDLRKKLSSGSRIITLSVRDKFGDNGITGLCIIDFIENAANIDSLLLSCRILGKDIERAFIACVLGTLKNEGVEQITATYIPTEKNGQVKDFYEKMGFILSAVSEEGEKKYLCTMDRIEILISNNYKINYYDRKNNTNSK
jgi:FkbH-like protein